VCERQGGGKIERESTREGGRERAQERETEYVSARFVCFAKKTIGIRLEERKNKYLCTRRHCHALQCTAMHCKTPANRYSSSDGFGNGVLVNNLGAHINI